jgi:ferredoxin
MQPAWHAVACFRQLPHVCSHTYCCSSCPAPGTPIPASEHTLSTHLTHPHSCVCACAGASIYDVAHYAGVGLPASCLQGSCTSCCAKVVSGESLVTRVSLHRACHDHEQHRTMIGYMIQHPMLSLLHSMRTATAYALPSLIAWCLQRCLHTNRLVLATLFAHRSHTRVHKTVVLTTLLCCCRLRQAAGPELPPSSFGEGGVCHPVLCSAPVRRSHSDTPGACGAQVEVAARAEVKAWPPYFPRSTMLIMCCVGARRVWREARGQGPLQRQAPVSELRITNPHV